MAGTLVPAALTLGQISAAPFSPARIKIKKKGHTVYFSSIPVKLELENQWKGEIQCRVKNASFAERNIQPACMCWDA